MHLVTSGVVQNEFGEVLLIQRNDTRTMAPPGGSIEQGELPNESVAREVREETGLIVMPVRLVGLDFWPTGTDGLLSFVFRCIQRGGKLATSRESPQVGFFPMNSLPRPMFTMHRRRIRQAISHRGGPPHWAVLEQSWEMRLARFLLVNVVYRSMNLKSRLTKQPSYEPPPDWRISGCAVIRRSDGQVLWLRDDESHRWRLPDAPCHPLEPPWMTTRRAAYSQAGMEVQLTDLTGIYLSPNHDHVRFVFSAEPTGEAVPDESNTTLSAYFSPGQEHPEFRRRDVAYALDASASDSLTQFRREDGAGEPS